MAFSCHMYITTRKCGSIIFEDNLLVDHHVVVFVGQTRAEFVKSAGHCLVVGGYLVVLPGLSVWIETVTSVVTAKLRQVAWSAICHSPSVVSWLLSKFLQTVDLVIVNNESDSDKHGLDGLFSVNINFLLFEKVHQY